MTAPSIIMEDLQRVAVAGRYRPAYRAQSLDPVLPIPAQRCNGRRSLAGEVDYITTPVAGRPVRVYDWVSGHLVRETVTDSGGLYAVPGLDGTRRYYVVAADTTVGSYDMAISPTVLAT